jgi:hypothetical protein
MTMDRFRNIAVVPPKSLVCFSDHVIFKSSSINKNLGISRKPFKTMLFTTDKTQKKQPVCSAIGTTNGLFSDLIR